jgi:aldose 1-epimerase
MTTLRLENGNLQLIIAPQTGASIVSLNLRREDEWLPLTRPTPSEAIAAGNPSLMASFTMAPWCNRLQDAQFFFQGDIIRLKPTTPEGYAQHGDVRKRPWQVVEQSPEAVTCTIDSRHFADFNFPFAMTAQISYRLHGDDFITEFTLDNVGERVMPAGFGFHPYFNRSFANRGHDEAQVQFCVAGLYPPMPSGAMLPVPIEQDFGVLAPLGEKVIDAVYGGWDGRAIIAYPQAQVRLEFICNEVLGHLCLFTPAGKPFFALEPMSQPLNAFNLFAQGQTHTGVKQIEPGQSLQSTFVIRIIQF